MYKGKFVFLLRPVSKSGNSLSLSFCGETDEDVPGRLLLNQGAL